MHPLNNVLPPLSTHYELNHALTYSVFSANSPDGGTRRNLFSDLSHFLVCQLHCIMVSLAHVLHVIGVGTNVQMIRIATRPIVAMMTAFQTGWNRTLGILPRQSVGKFWSWPESIFIPSFWFRCEPPVSFVGPFTNPKPTIIFTLNKNFFPKSFFRWSFSNWHGWGTLTQIDSSSKLI